MQKEGYNKLFLYSLFILILIIICINLTTATKYTVGDAGYDYAEITSCMQQINDTFDSCYLNTANLTYTINYTAIFNFGIDLSGATVGTAIILNNTNITLDCSSSTILGNKTDYLIHTPPYKGISVNFNATTIQNCNLKYLDYGIQFNSTNGTIINNLFFENTYGLYSDSSPNVTIKDNIFSNNSVYGLWFSNCQYQTIINNSFIESTYSQVGIYMTLNSSNGYIKNNTFLNIAYAINIINSYNQTLIYNNITSSATNWKIRIDGNTRTHFIHAIDTSNYVNSYPVYYNNSIQNYDFSNLNIGFLMCNNCTNITIRNITLSSGGSIVELTNTNYSNFQNNILSTTQYGFYGYNSYFLNITNNTFSNQSVDIYLINGGNNTIINNTFGSSRYGVYLTSSNGNTLINNYFNLNERALYISSAQSSNITNNTFKNNVYAFYDSSYATNNNLFRNNSILHSSNSQLINLTLDTPWASQNENVSFMLRMNYYNFSRCSLCTFNITIRPETTLSYSLSGNNVSGSFFPTQIGFYSILVNVTDTFNNTESRNYGVVVNGSESNITYYLYAKTAGHSQYPGLVRDIGSFKKLQSSDTETNYCSTFVGGYVDELPNNTLGVIKDINISLKYISGYSGAGVKSSVFRYGYYDSSTGDYATIIGSTNTTRSTQVNSTKLNWTMDYIKDWYRLYLRVGGSYPTWISESNKLTFVNISYISTSTPEISYLSNYAGARILSATSAPSNLNNASIILEGEGSTEIVFQMPNPGTYTIKYDGVECTATGSTCKLNSQNNGVINLTLTLGSEHTITILDTTTPLITLTPSSATSIAPSAAYTVSCSATDNVAVSSVSLTLDGVSCSEVSSCSTTYTPATTGTRTLSCTAIDTSGNPASSSVDITVSLDAGGGGAGGGGSSEPSEEIPVTPIIEEETPVELPPVDENIINIPQDEITSAVEGNTIVVNLGDLASITYSYIDVDGKKKPKVDIKFNQVGIKRIGALVNINYFDFKIIIKLLFILILILLLVFIAYLIYINKRRIGRYLRAKGIIKN